MAEANIVQAHIDFAREVVALARKHKMTGLRMEYRRSFTPMDAEGPFETVTMSWSEGRHGVISQIQLQYAGRHDIPEQQEPASTAQELHPLSIHALNALRSVQKPGSNRPRQQLNPGVAARLEAEGLIEVYAAPSPYASKRGMPVPTIRITDAGRAALQGPGPG